MREIVEVIHGDHRCIKLFGVHGGDAIKEWKSTLVEWLDHTPDVPPDLIVLTGAQFGPYSVKLRVVDAPTPVGPSWEDVSEISIVCGDEIGVGELIDGPGDWVHLLPGSYRLRVSARGRTEGVAREDAFPDDDADEDADEEPLEFYLLELWRAAEAPPEVVREDSQLARDIHNPPVPTWPAERAPGLEAAWAIINDVRHGPGARSLTDEMDEVAMSLELAGTPVRLFNRLRYAFGWPPCQGGSGGPNSDSVGGTSYHNVTLPEDDSAYDSAGEIVTTIVELTKPRTVVLRWNWVLEVEGAMHLDARPRLLPEDSTVTITFAEINGAGQDPRTLVRFSHVGIPRAWRTDLEKLWRWHLTLNASR